MPVHGLRLNLEFLAIVGGAAVTSLFVTGQLVSNALFTALIAVLFFLMGVELDTRKLWNGLKQYNEIGIGILMVYLVTPALAFLVYTTVNGALGDAFIAIGVSAAAVGSPVVWSNLGKGEGDVALAVAGFSVVSALLVIPLLLAGVEIGPVILEFASRNVVFAAVPFAAGVASQRLEHFLFDDFRQHFSKLAVWLIVLTAGVQFQLLYQAEGLSFLGDMALAAGFMAAFVAASFGIGYRSSKALGILERKSRSIGFVSGAKSIGIALFLASQISGHAVALVAVYFFVRQAVCGAIAEYFREGSLAWIRDFRQLLPARPF